MKFVGGKVMSKSDLHKLGKTELLQIIYEQEKQITTLKSEIENLNKKIDDRTIDLKEAGSIAEASLKINKIFEEAQKAADEYLNSVKKLGISNAEKVTNNITNEEIYENISIARKELEELHLLVPDNEVFFDCFYFPPFTEKTYYAQIVKSESGYSAHIAYTYYADFWGLSSYSQPFKNVYSMEHSSKIGRVICKIINLDAHLANDLKSIAEQYATPENNNKEAVVIDGICCGIRLYDNGGISHTIISHNPPDDDTILNELKKISQKI